MRFLVAGMTTLDFLSSVSMFPLENSENRCNRQDIVVGGSAGRGAITLSRLGGDVKQIATIGSGEFAGLLKYLTTLEGVSTLWLDDSEEPCQYSTVLLSEDTGARTTIANKQPTFPMVGREDIDKRMPYVDFVLADCTDVNLLCNVVASAQRMKVPVLVDTGTFKRETIPFLHGVEYIVAPEKFFPKFDLGEDELGSLLERVRSRFDARVVTMTMGERGGMFCDGTGVHEYKGYPVKTVDSCGAGDVFHGALAYAIANGYEMLDAHNFASYTAAQKCSGFGNASIPSLAEVVGKY